MHVLEPTHTYLYHKLVHTQAPPVDGQSTAGPSSTPLDASYPPPTNNTHDNNLHTDNTTTQLPSSSQQHQQPTADPIQLWYPPMRNALECLSMLYHVLDAQVFSGLAQDAVSAAAGAIQSGSRVIAKQQGLMDGYVRRGGDV